MNRPDELSFLSDVSFPERMLDDPHPPGSLRRSQRGEMHARVVERDRHELWAVLRSFRRVYGDAVLRSLIAEVFDERL